MLRTLTGTGTSLFKAAAAFWRPAGKWKFTHMVDFSKDIRCVINPKENWHS